MNKMIKSALMILVLSGFSLADDWQLQGIFFDYEMPRSDGYGIHGTVVAPDGNIWVAMHGPIAGDTLFVDDGAGSIDTVETRPIFVFTPDGVHTAFSPIRFAAGDTLTYSGKGMALDIDGNIIYATNKLYRFNYQTGEMMNSFDVAYDEEGSMSSLTQPSVDQDGNVYVSWVAGASRPVVKVDASFSVQTTVAPAGVSYNRSTLVTPDANRIFLGSTWNSGGITVLEANFLGTAYDSVGMYGGVEHTWDNGGTDTTGTVMIWAEVLAWNLGVLWAGDTDPGWYSYFAEGISSPHPYAGRWSGYNPNTGELVDDFGIGQSVSGEDNASELAATGVTCNPRSLATSGDGTTIYVGDFSTNVIQIWHNDNPTSLAIDEEGNSSIVAMGYALHSAYPNPFNPSTTISYEVGRTGNAKLEIFNMLGQSVRTLANGWHFNGVHQVTWDGNDNNGNTVPSGTYIYQLTSTEVTFSKRVTLVK